MKNELLEIKDYLIKEYVEFFTKESENKEDYIGIQNDNGLLIHRSRKDNNEEKSFTVNCDYNENNKLIHYKSLDLDNYYGDVEEETWIEYNNDNKISKIITSKNTWDYQQERGESCEYKYVFVYYSELIRIEKYQRTYGNGYSGEYMFQEYWGTEKETIETKINNLECGDIITITGDINVIGIDNPKINTDTEAESITCIFKKVIEESKIEVADEETEECYIITFLNNIILKRICVL